MGVRGGAECPPMSKLGGRHVFPPHLKQLKKKCENLSNYKEHNASRTSRISLQTNVDHFDILH